MEEVTLISFVNSLKGKRIVLVKQGLNIPFWKIRAWLSLDKEIRRVNTIIKAGERYLRHQMHQH